MTLDSPDAQGAHTRGAITADWRALPLVAWLLSLICALAITPTLDDWWAATPLTRFDPSAFLPGVFWRPFETILRFIMGAWPEAYPVGLHVAVMLGHGLSAWFLWRAVSRVTRSPVMASWVSALFILSPAVMMAAWSLDSANQTWSTACGLGALWARLKAPERLVGPWLVWCIVALFWKESGAAWFIAAPLLASGLLVLSQERDAIPFKRVFGAIALGLCLLALYFVIRKALALDGAVTAQQGRYALNLSLITTLKHVAMLLGAAWSTLETVALLSETHRALPVALLCGALGAPLLLFALWHGRHKMPSLAFVVSALGAGALMGPHAIFGRVSEMHTHPLLAATLLMFSVLVSPHLFERRLARVALGLWVVGALGATTHKYATWLETCRGAEAVQAQLVAQWEGPPVQRVCTVWRSERPPGYATFSAGHYEAAGSGRALMAAWGWDADFDTKTVFAAERCPPGWAQAVVRYDAASGPRVERVTSTHEGGR